MYNIEDLIKIATEYITLINGKYVPSRPVPFNSWLFRFKDAWAVLTGKADAVKWTGQ